MRNLVGHKATEYGITRILCSGGKDGDIHVFVDVEEVANFAFERFPLVVSKVIEHDEEDFLTLVEQREDGRLK